jgi:hypothetical protein
MKTALKITPLVILGALATVAEFTYPRLTFGLILGFALACAVVHLLVYTTFPNLPRWPDIMEKYGIRWRHPFKDIFLVFLFVFSFMPGVLMMAMLVCGVIYLIGGLVGLWPCAECTGD